MNIRKYNDIVQRSTPKIGFFINHLFGTHVNSLSEFEKQLEDLAFPQDEDDLNGFSPYADILGDGWEQYCHLMRTIHSYHPKIQTTENGLTPAGTIGVDAVAKWNGKLKTLQDKYKGRSKAWETELREGEKMKLERFRLQSIDTFNIDPNDTDSMVVFTNAKGIHYWTNNELLAGKVKCVGRKLIEKLTNGKDYFDEARRILKTQNSKVSW